MDWLKLLHVVYQTEVLSLLIHCLDYLWFVCSHQYWFDQVLLFFSLALVLEYAHSVWVAVVPQSLAVLHVKVCECHFQEFVLVFDHKCGLYFHFYEC